MSTLVDRSLLLPSTCVPLERWGTRSLSRAHLNLQDRKQVATDATQGLDLAVQTLGTLLGDRFEVTPRLLDSTCRLPTCLGASSVFALFELASLGSRAVLELDLALVLALIQQFSGERAASQLGVCDLTRAERAALGHILLQATHALRGHAGVDRLWAPRLSSIETRAADVEVERFETRCVGVELLIRVGETKGRGRFLVPSQALQTALVEVPRDELQVTEDLLSIELPLDRFLPPIELDARAFRALNAGDVVMLNGIESTPFGIFGLMVCRAPLFELFGALAQDGFVLARSVQFPTRKEEAVPPTDATLIQEPSNLPVELEVELTRLQVSLSCLSTLRPGRVLPLRVSAGEPVLLKVNGQSVARAELVELEGEVGARILEMLAKAPRAQTLRSPGEGEVSDTRTQTLRSPGEDELSFTRTRS